MAKVKLIGAYNSPFSRRVEMALKLKGIEYEFIDEDIKNKSPLLLKHNPIHKKVPVLLHDGKSIVESLVIVEYIDEIWDGPSILPKDDPYERAMARFWAKLMDEKLIPAMWKAYWSTGEEREKNKEEAIENLTFLENEIKGKKFFGGDTIGLVDIVANFIAWSKIIEKFVGIKFIAQDKFPNLSKWVDEYTNVDFVKENLPAEDRLASIFRGLNSSSSS